MTNIKDKPQKEMATTKHPAVSIIVPAYNMGKYIADCLNSVLLQTFQDFEVICIDDGSLDNSLSIFNEYAKKDPRIKVITQKNMGAVYARNNAIEIARGEYIFPLDSDDMIAPECIEKLYNIITTTKYVAVSPLGYFFKEKNGPIRPIWIPKPYRFLMYSWFRLSNSTMYPKTLWKKYGGYDVQFNNLGSEDFDFFLNFIDDHQPICQTKERLFYYRKKPPAESRNASVSHNKINKLKRQKIICHKRPIMRKTLLFPKIVEFIILCKRVFKL